MHDGGGGGGGGGDGGPGGGVGDEPASIAALYHGFRLAALVSHSTLFHRIWRKGMGEGAGKGKGGEDEVAESFVVLH